VQSTLFQCLTGSAQPRLEYDEEALERLLDRSDAAIESKTKEQEAFIESFQVLQLIQLQSQCWYICFPDI
jgi:hypothetical protein